MSDTATKERAVPRLKARYNETLRGQLRASWASATSCRCRGSRRSSSTWASAPPPAQASLLEGAAA